MSRVNLSVALLDQRFMGKGGLECPREFPGGLVAECGRLERQKRRSLPVLLGEFKQAVEAKALDGFWESRKKAKLRAKPEAIGQALLAIFLKGRSVAPAAELSCVRSALALAS